MKKEYALNILHNASVYHPDYLDALNMAIESLEEESIIDMIRKDINSLTVYYTTKVKGTSLISQKAVNRVIDKYKRKEL